MPRKKPVSNSGENTPPIEGQKHATKPYTITPSERGLGHLGYGDKAMAPLFTQPIVKKGESGRNTWADTALVLVHRAKKAAQTYGKKDFNALYRLVLSAGIAYDKAFPTVVQPTSGNLVVQLFGSLGLDTAKAILEPPRPVLVDSNVSTPHQIVEAYLGETIEVPPAGTIVPSEDTLEGKPLDETT